MQAVAKRQRVAGCYTRDQLLGICQRKCSAQLERSVKKNKERLVQLAASVITETELQQHEIATDQRKALKLSVSQAAELEQRKTDLETGVFLESRVSDHLTACYALYQLVDQDNATCIRLKHMAR